MDRDVDDKQPALFQGTFHPESLDEEPAKQEPVSPRQLEGEGQLRLSLPDEC